MSRSYRRTPKIAYDGCHSEKSYKIIWHQRMRAALRQALCRADDEEIMLPHEREVWSDWDFGKSRRVWCDARRFPDWMRK